MPRSDYHYLQVETPCVLCPINSGLHETDETLLKENLPDLPDILELFRACNYGLALRHELSKLLDDIAGSHPPKRPEKHSFIMYVYGVPYKDTEMDPALLGRVKDLGVRMIRLRDVLQKWKRARFDDAEVMNRMKTWSEKFASTFRLVADGCIDDELRVALATRDIILGFLHIVLANYPKTEDGFQIHECDEHQPPQPIELNLEDHARFRLGHYFMYICYEVYYWLLGTKSPLFHQQFVDELSKSDNLSEHLSHSRQHLIPAVANQAEDCIRQYDRWLIPLLAFWKPLNELNVNYGNTRIWANEKATLWGLIEGCRVELNGRYEPHMKTLNDLWALAKSSGVIVDEGKVDRALAHLEFFGSKIDQAEGDDPAAQSFRNRLRGIPIEFPTRQHRTSL